MIFSLLSGGEWWGLRSNESECCNNPEESGQTSGLLPDYPDKLAQHWAVIRKNTRFPGQVGSTLCTHPEKHAISRTSWLNTGQSSGETRDFPDSRLCSCSPDNHTIPLTGLLNTGQSFETAQPHGNPSSDDIGDLPLSDGMPF